MIEEALRDLAHDHRGRRSKIILGSRGSELARAQTALVTAALRNAWPNLEIEVRIIKTTGDQRGEDPSDRKAGRKGLFTGEIELALSAREIDVAVHSAKDLPSEATSGLEIRAVLPRAAVEDVLVSKRRGGLLALPMGCVVGTGSVRRQYQLRWQRPDLKFFSLRGNVPTRLRKLLENPWEAIVLARAGLERLRLSEGKGAIEPGDGRLGFEPLDMEVFLPAGGQGIIALQVRRDDVQAKEILELVNDNPTLLCLRAEREFLRLLQADCGTPVGVLATLELGIIKIRGQVFKGDNAVPRGALMEGPEGDPELIGRKLKEAIDDK